MLSRSERIRLCRARDALTEPCDRPRSVHEIAREAGMSTGQLIRVFAAVFGETPHQRRIAARIARAQHLLALGDLPVTAVCLEVGFTSLGSFSALFARRVGVPPSVYRRQARALVTVPAELSRALAPGCLSLMGAAFARAPLMKQFPRSAPLEAQPSFDSCGSSSTASWSTTKTRRSPSTRTSSGS
jgi:AraC-like DNA-binding protein